MSATVIAFPSRSIALLGLVIAAAGIAAFIFVLTSVGGSGTDPMTFVGSGDLRPPMVVLPPDEQGRTIAMSDREITQGQYFRVMGTVDQSVASREAADWNGCPVPLLADFPVTCLTSVEAARYAHELTRLTNLRRRQNEPELTDCYEFNAGSVMLSDRNCTGFRLPTATEWLDAALADRLPDAVRSQAASCDYALTDACRATGPTPAAAGRRPNPWHLYDLYGNVSEMAEDDDMIGSAVEYGGSWDRPFSLDAPPAATYSDPRSANIGFRIVRTIWVGHAVEGS